MPLLILEEIFLVSQLRAHNHQVDCLEQNQQMLLNLQEVYSELNQQRAHNHLVDYLGQSQQTLTNHQEDSSEPNQLTPNQQKALLTSSVPSQQPPLRKKKTQNHPAEVFSVPLNQQLLTHQAVVSLEAPSPLLPEECSGINNLQARQAVYSDLNLSQKKRKMRKRLSSQQGVCLDNL
jgi:hypothetical protein